MAHTLIVGTTESGKTTLAKQFCTQARKWGNKIIVFDPGYTTWDADYQTHDFDAFCRVVRASENCFVFVDEAARHCGQKDAPKSVWLASEARHIGHSSFFIAQRAMMVNISIRENCSHLFLFESSPKQCELLVEDWNRQDLIGGKDLSQGEYLYCNKLSKEVTKHKVW